MIDDLASHQQQPHYIRDFQDDIFIRDLLLVIIKRKKLITGVILVFTILAVVYSFLITPLYKVKSTSLPPASKDIATLNASRVRAGLQPVQKWQLYNEFHINLSSIEIRNKVFKELESSNKYSLIIDDDHNIKRYLDEYKITRPKKEKKSNSIPRIVVTFTGKHPSLAADAVNKIVLLANQKTVADQVAEIEEQVRVKLRSIKQDISSIREKAAKDVQDEIMRLTEKDNIERAQLVREMAILRQFAEIKKQDRLEKLQVAARIAKKVGLADHYSLRNDGIEIKLLESPEQEYDRGERVLLAEIEELKNRKSNDVFVGGLRGLQKKIELLKKNQAVIAMSSRKNNDAFIKALREKELKLARLASIKKINISDINAVSVDQVAYPSSDKIKPRRSLIVLIGLILGTIAGLFLAFVLNTLEENPLSEASK